MGVQIPHGKGQFLEERTCLGMPDDTFPYFMNSWRGIFIGRARYDVQSAVSTHKHNISLKSAQYLTRRRRRRRSKPNSDDQARKTVALSCSLINEHEHDLRKLTSLVVNCGFFGFWTCTWTGVASSRWIWTGDLALSWRRIVTESYE